MCVSEFQFGIKDGVEFFLILNNKIGKMVQIVVPTYRFYKCIIL